MNIGGIIWIKEIEAKIWVKHHVEKEEVEQALASNPKFRFLEKGQRKVKIYTWHSAAAMQEDIFLSSSSIRPQAKH